MNSVLKPNYRRAREIKAQIDEVSLEYEAACEAGNYDLASDLKDLLQELERDWHMTGVTSEYEL